MRKIDRLFEIVQLLRGQRLRTADYIAKQLGVSVRTIYRDIQGLMASGVPIEGERGVGYIIRQTIDLPPLHFTELELKALKLGIEMVSKAADPEIASAAEEAAIKINDALPLLRQNDNSRPLAHIYFKTTEETKTALAQIRIAVEEKRKLDLDYKAESSKISSRRVRPLGLEYWGKVWTFTAWCELRNDFRVFRADRITASFIMDEYFKDEPGKSYKDFIQLMEQCK